MIEPLVARYTDSGGWIAVFTRAMLCNWTVSLGVVSAFLSKDVVGKILATGHPI